MKKKKMNCMIGLFSLLSLTTATAALAAQPAVIGRPKSEILKAVATAIGLQNASEVDLETIAIRNRFLLHPLASNAGGIPMAKTAYALADQGPYYGYLLCNESPKTLSVHLGATNLRQMPNDVNSIWRGGAYTGIVNLKQGECALTGLAYRIQGAFFTWNRGAKFYSTHTDQFFLKSDSESPDFTYYGLTVAWTNPELPTFNLKGLLRLLRTYY